MSSIRVRDGIIVTICALFVYLLRGYEQIDLLPVWRTHFQVHSGFQHGRPEELLPNPVISDLDDDGKMELVFVTGNFELQVCRLPDDQLLYTQQQQALPELKNCNSVELVIDASHRPVAMDAGYIEQAKTENSLRSQASSVAYFSHFVLC